MDYAARLAEITDLISQASSNRKADYDLWCEATALNRVIFGPIRDLKAKRPLGIRQLTLRFLSNEATRFVSIDLSARSDSGRTTNRCHIATYRLEQQNGRWIVIDETSGIAAGELNSFSLSSSPWQDDAQHNTWTDPWSILNGFVAPIAGPALQHAAFRDQAALVNSIIASSETARRLAIDTELDELHHKHCAFKEKALAVATAGLDLDALNAEHSELVNLMKTHDWTWHYADRHIEFSARKERQIILALTAIKPIEALALWHLHSWSPLNEFTWNHVMSRANIARSRAA